MSSSVIETKAGGKVGWRDQTLASMSVPPTPLMAIVGIVILLLCLSSHSNYKSQMQQTKVGFNLFLSFLPLLMIMLAYFMTRYGRFQIMSQATAETAVTTDQSGGASPWGVSLFLGLMLVLVSYQSYFQSKWWL